jgi:hypothetical protein
MELLGWGAAYDRLRNNYRDALRAITRALLLAHVVRPAFVRCRKPKLLSLSWFRPSVQFPRFCGRCVANVPRLFCAQDDSGSADGQRIHVDDAPACLPQTPGAWRHEFAEDQTLVNPREWARRSARRWHLGVAANSGATSGRVATSKAGNPQVRAFVFVLGSTCSDQQGTCGLSQGRTNQGDVGKRQTWGDAPQLRASADCVVLTSTNCLGFRSSPSIRDRQNLASTERHALRKPRHRNFTRTGCSECAVGARNRSVRLEALGVRTTHALLPWGEGGLR